MTSPQIQIPKSILSVSSDELHNLSLTAEGRPVTLDCSPEAFRIFVDVIFKYVSYSE